MVPRRSSSSSLYGMRRKPLRRSFSLPDLGTLKSSRCGTILAICLLILTVTNMMLLQVSERVLPIQHKTVLEPDGGGGSRHLQAIPSNADRERPLPGKKIAWLMSFPNSGTSFTSRLVRDATKTVSASNYADETPTGKKGIKEAVFPDQYPEGPFWIKPEASPEFVEPDKIVLTKVRFQKEVVHLHLKS